ncbi:MAG: tRNA (N6-threonylcarbamoyladenosine(37)-N6)-methyltransferase TrmO [Gammaproteobacteria bacterium]|nr:tRNA (N6-threonylcarbamoyladenosine(37)-N6)-methyltransferase TrmO [Gammaproteobacteria bacterium]
MNHQITPIGFVESCFKEKFGVPRQPGLVSQAPATLHFYPPYDQDIAFAGLEAFSHLWIMFLFHLNRDEQWRPLVRPPRLGGNEKRGVFSTRSPYHPNAIGLSVVEIVSIETTDHSCRIQIKNADLVHGTPIVDIKPYLPYVDAIPNAHSGFAPSAPASKMAVHFSPPALEQCLQKSLQHRCDVRQLIQQILETDPRPAYKQNIAEDKIYGMRLFDFDVRWQASHDHIDVLQLDQAE